MSQAVRDLARRDVVKGLKWQLLHAMLHMRAASQRTDQSSKRDRTGSRASKAKYYLSFQCV